MIICCFGGIGLGLVILCQIVEQMGGWIKVESLIDIGSQFIFQVLLGIDWIVFIVVFEFFEKIWCQCILIVDDNFVVLYIIFEIFCYWGMVVDMVGLGLEVCDMVEWEVCVGCIYDFLLIDWKMFEIDGLQMVCDICVCLVIVVLLQVVMMIVYDILDLIQVVVLDNICGFFCKFIMFESLLYVLESLFGYVMVGL